MIDKRYNLLWGDGIAGILVGVLMLVLYPWLTELYALPSPFVIFNGFVNLLYGVCGLALASQQIRRMKLILLMAGANLTWGFVCAGLVLAFRETASVFGLGHFVAEGLFASVLACLEWRWREYLHGGSR